MTEGDIRTALKRLRKNIAELPRDQQKPLRNLFREVVRRHVAIRNDCGRARDGLEDLTIMLKYLVFDYEATLREQSAKE